MGSSSNLEKLFAGGGKVHTRNADSIVTVSFSPKNYDKIVKRLDSFINKTTIRKIVERAAKRAADAGVAATKREIAADTTLKPAEIGNKVKAYAHGSSLGAAIGVKISDTARPLSDFAFTPKKPTPKTPPIVEIYKGEKKVLNKGAFVAKMPTGHIGIFQRETEKALPIRQLPGPSVTGLFTANERAHTLVQDTIWETFEKRIEHELEYLLSQ
jgi:hypothetical protein